jgi:hypothetical protein
MPLPNTALALPARADASDEVSGYSLPGIRQTSMMLVGTGGAVLRGTKGYNQGIGARRAGTKALPFHAVGIVA